MSENILTQEHLKEFLSYDAETGAFTWRVRTSNRVRVGAVAGCRHSAGYRMIRVCGKLYKAHRLAWLYIRGPWPQGEIDHINGANDDNRLANLRDVNHTENMQNQRGVRGYDRNGKSWQARIWLGGKKICLGTFQTTAEARAAYLTAKKIYHPTAPAMA